MSGTARDMRTLPGQLNQRSAFDAPNSACWPIQSFLSYRSFYPIAVCAQELVPPRIAPNFRQRGRSFSCFSPHTLTPSGFMVYLQDSCIRIPTMLTNATEQPYDRCPLSCIPPPHVGVSASRVPLAPCAHNRRVMPPTQPVYSRLPPTFPPAFH